MRVLAKATLTPKEVEKFTKDFFQSTISLFSELKFDQKGELESREVEVSIEVERVDLFEESLSDPSNEGMKKFESWKKKFGFQEPRTIILN